MIDITGYRLGLLSLLTSTIVLPALYQPFLDIIWSHLQHNPVYRSSTFETFWTVLCYGAFEGWMTTVYLNRPEWRLAQKNKKDNQAIRRPHGMRRPSRRVAEGLTYVFPLLLLDLTMIKKFADVSLEDMLVSGNYDPSLARVSCRGNTCQSHFLMPSIHNFSWKSPLQTQRALPDSAPSSRRLTLELIASFVIYDACFFAFHLTMHLLPGLKTWHAPHHTHAEIHPQITNQLHIFERLGLVLLANFSLNIIKSHVLTRTLFVPIFVWLLVEIHSGLDLPWGYEKILPKGWGGGASKHARHHASGNGGLEPYFTWCDALLAQIQTRTKGS